MRYIESFDGTRIAYQRTGNGPPVVLIPGINFSLEVWDSTITALAASHDVIAMDLRGHGSSDKPAGSYAYDVHAKDVTALVSTLDLRGFTLTGWSLGGAVALRYASDVQPSLARLILCGPAAPRFTSAPDYKHGLPEDAVRGLMERERTDRPAYRRWVIEQSFHNRPPEDTLNWLWNLSMKAPSWASLACLDALITEDLRPALSRVQVPTCIVRGAHDNFMTEGAAQELVSAIPDCELINFADSGHIPFLEESDRFAALLQEFATAPVSSS